MASIANTPRKAQAFCWVPRSSRMTRELGNLTLRLLTGSVNSS